MKRFVDKKLNIDQLKTSLDNSKISAKNNALYQTIYQLINKLHEVNEDTNARITEVSGSSGGGSSGSSIIPSNTVLDLDGTNNPGTSVEYSRGDHKHGIDSSLFSDHVVMSDGGIPNAQPLNNGAGQFLYTVYTP